jgi:hypothetical protein
MWKSGRQTQSRHCDRGLHNSNRPPNKTPRPDMDRRRPRRTRPPSDGRRATVRGDRLRRQRLDVPRPRTADQCSPLSLRPDGRIVTGFGSGRDFTFSEFVDDVEHAGLVSDLRSPPGVRPFTTESNFLVADVPRPAANLTQCATGREVQHNDSGTASKPVFQPTLVPSTTKYTSPTNQSTRSSDRSPSCNSGLVTSDTRALGAQHAVWQATRVDRGMPSGFRSQQILYMRSRVS